jgi:outer membrane protein assembly factor BamB
MRTAALVCVGALGGFLALSAFAADWPQWRGPARDGISTETGLLKQWPEGGPKLLWENKEVGLGYSTPAVVGDHLYVISNSGTAAGKSTGNESEFVLALNTADGKKEWSTTIGKVGPNSGPQYPGSRGTPTVDGKHLYALGSDGDLACLDASSGQIVWKKNLRNDFGGKPGMWAYSESPLVDGGALVCTPGGKDATIVALAKSTGDVLWKSAVPGADQAAYSSPIVVEAGGTKQYVQFLQKGVVGVDAKTGKFLWRFDKTAKGSPANIPTPVAKDALVYSSSGKGGGALFQLKANGDAFEAAQVYFNKDLPTSIGGSVRVGDYLYGTNEGGLMCVEFATGKVKWQNKSVGPGAVCYADGRLYLHGETGGVALVEANPDGYHEKGRFTPPDQPKRGRTKAWPYPVIANGRLYLRDLDRLWCYEVKDTTTTQ